MLLKYPRMPLRMPRSLPQDFFSLHATRPSDQIVCNCLRGSGMCDFIACDSRILCPYLLVVNSEKEVTLRVAARVRQNTPDISSISLAHGEPWNFQYGAFLFLGWCLLGIFAFADTQSAENISAAALLALHLEG